MLNKRLLFICDDNAFSSILAEALANHLGEGDGWRAFSAGLLPAGHVDPLAFDLLHEAGVPARGLSSKSWQFFTFPDAPGIDLVITMSARTGLIALPAFCGSPKRMRLAENEALADVRRIACPGERRKAARTLLQHYANEISALIARDKEGPRTLNRLRA